MRSFVLAMAILATGCFHFAPVSSLSSVEDDRVRVYDGEHWIAMDHATAHGRVIQGAPTLGSQYVDQSAECALPSCGWVDVSHATNVEARRLNVPATIAIIAGSAIAVAGAVIFGLIVALAARPLPIMIPP